MVIKSLIQKLTGEAKLKEVAETVAQTCTVMVWEKVAHRVHTMTTPQAQGYIRGRAARTIKSQLDRALVRHDIHESRRLKMKEMAMNLLIGMMLQRKHEEQLVTNVLRRAA